MTAADANGRTPAAPAIPPPRIAPDVEYFTDYDRFREAQICCAVAEDGTSLFSRIENRRFMHTVRHDLSERVIELLCRQIHREICTLHYGGQVVE